MARSNGPCSRPRASDISLSRDSGWRGCWSSTLRTANPASGQRLLLIAALEAAGGEIDLDIAETDGAGILIRRTW